MPSLSAANSLGRWPLTIPKPIRVTVAAILEGLRLRTIHGEPETSIIWFSSPALAVAFSGFNHD